VIPDPPQAVEAEQALLGALMTSRGILRAVLVQSGLRREHFGSEKHRAIFAACQRIAARGEDVDAITVWAQLERDEDVPAGITRSELSDLASNVPAPGNAPQYAGLVIEAAVLRAKREAALTILEGVADHDDRRILRGIEAASADVTDAAGPTEPHELRSALLDYLREPKPPEVLELPWATLNGFIGAGGMLRGELCLLAGWTNIGKSIALDQLMGAFATQGYRTWMFCTEMSWLERMCRWVAAQTGIEYRRLIRREKLTDDEFADSNLPRDRGTPRRRRCHRPAQSHPVQGHARVRRHPPPAQGDRRARGLPPDLRLATQHGPLP
jgi:replicative DNA helicase